VHDNEEEQEYLYQTYEERLCAQSQAPITRLWACSESFGNALAAHTSSDGSNEEGHAQDDQGANIAAVEGCDGAVDLQ